MNFTCWLNISSRVLELWVSLQFFLLIPSVIAGIGGMLRKGGPSDDSGNVDDISDGSEARTPSLRRRIFDVASAGEVKPAAMPSLSLSDHSSGLEMPGDRSLQRSLRYKRLLEMAQSNDGHDEVDADRSKSHAPQTTIGTLSGGMDISQSSQQGFDEDELGQFDRQAHFVVITVISEYSIMPLILIIFVL